MYYYSYHLYSYSPHSYYYYYYSLYSISISLITYSISIISSLYYIIHPLIPYNLLTIIYRSILADQIISNELILISHSIIHLFSINIFSIFLVIYHSHSLIFQSILYYYSYYYDPISLRILPYSIIIVYSMIILHFLTTILMFKLVILTLALLITHFRVFIILFIYNITFAHIDRFFCHYKKLVNFIVENLILYYLLML